MTPPDDDAALAPTYDAGRGPGDAALAPTQDGAVAPTGAEASQRVATDAGHTAGARMANLRPGSPAGMPLARARVFSALFGDDSTLGKFGRFRVLERLGAGGMGVVYEAYDPDLARGVALKLVNVAAKDRDTALAEAKALARLSHPNVVPIYDVGLARSRDHVYLVMELVRGETLRQWAVGRQPREILAVYQQAGAALAAAHAAGLVHRDFKPENAIVGADGRVRVVDFGLACEADDPARETGERRGAAGTPGFMAPEIAAGAPVTAAADQFSFCVALAGAFEIAGQPVPRRIAGVLERGRAAEPRARFASMPALLQALARDPARTWRRGGAALGVVAGVGVVMYLLGQRQGDAADGPDPCDAGPAQLAAAWSPPARAVALDRVAALDAYGKSLRPLLERGLDAHDRRWTQAYRAACSDRRGGTESTTLVDRRQICLRRGSDALASVGALVAHIEADKLSQLPLAVQSLPDPAACSDVAALLSDVEPPSPALAPAVAQVRREIAEARIQLGAGRHDQALTEARNAAFDARGVDYPPVLAEALVVQGHARMLLVDRRAAVPILLEATSRAIASHADALAVEAWARRAWAEGTSGGWRTALDGLGVIEPLAQRTTSAAFARALLYNNIGSVELGSDQPDRADRALAYFERALRESQTVGGEGGLELLAIRHNIGLLMPDHARGDQLLVEVAAERAARLGADHYDTLDTEWIRGDVTIEDLRTATGVLTRVCAGFEQLARSDRAAECWIAVGLLQWDLAERGAAIQSLERALRSQARPDAAPTLSLVRGDALAAVRQFGDALAARPPKPEDQWWRRLAHGDLTIGLGRARRAAGDLPGARRALEAGIAELEPIVRAQSRTGAERQLGRARVELTVVLSGMRTSPAYAAAVDAAADAWLRRVGEPAELVRLRASIKKDSAR